MPDDDVSGRNNKPSTPTAMRTPTTPFSMFDPIAAFDGLSGNWINVPEVAKLGIQAAHKKITLAREERTELQRALEKLQKQFRGMQEHHVQQMNATTSRVDFLERSTKRKKKYRASEFRPSQHMESQRMSSRPSTAGREMLSASRRKSQQRNTLETNVIEESSDESSIQGLTTEQQEMLDKIEPLESQMCDLEVGRRKELERAEAFLKQLEQLQTSTERLENRLNDELSTRALSLLVRQLMMTELPSKLESFMADKFQVFKKMTDNVEKKVEGELALLAKKEHSLAKSVAGLANHLQELEEEVHALGDSDGSSSQDSPRHSAREASTKLFAGSRSPRVSRSARQETPLETTHDAPALAGDAEASARLALLMADPELSEAAAEGGTEVTSPRGSGLTPGRDEGSPNQDGLRVPKEKRKKRGPSSRTSARTVLSGFSDDDLGIGDRMMLPKLVEESLMNLIQTEKFSSLMDQEFDLTFLSKTLEQHIQQISKMEVEQSTLQQASQRNLEKLQSCQDATVELQKFLEKAQHQMDDHFQQIETRLAKSEQFSERGLDAYLANTEGRILEFLAEGEAERARLWHQMSVLFPRFMEGKERMNMSEARAYALDVRLDHLEGYIVQNGYQSAPASPSDSNWRRASRLSGPPGETLLESPGSDADPPDSPQRATSARDVRSSPSLDRHSFSYKPRPALPKAPARRRLHDVLKRHLQEDLTCEKGPASQEADMPPSLLLKVNTSMMSFQKDCSKDEAEADSASEHFYMDTGPSLPAPLAEAKPPEPDRSPKAQDADPGVQAPLADAENGARTAWFGRSMHDALSDVMDETRNLGTGEVQVVRVLNPRSDRPHSWLIGDAAAGRVLLGQDPPLPHPATLPRPARSARNSRTYRP